MKHKRENPLRRLQVNKLIVENRKKQLLFSQNKNLQPIICRYEPRYSAEIVEECPTLRAAFICIKMGGNQVINQDGSVSYFSLEQIRFINVTLHICYLISTENPASILNPARNPEIDEIGRPTSRWAIIDRMELCFDELLPEKYWYEGRNLYAPCTLR